MKPYHPNNLKYQPFATWKIIVLAYVAKILGVQFNICGIPYGAAGSKEFNRKVAEVENIVARCGRSEQESIGPGISKNPMFINSGWYLKLF